MFLKCVIFPWMPLNVLNLALWRASLVAQMLKNLPATQETWVRSLGQEDPLEKRKATRSSILAWRIPWTEESCGLQSMDCKELDTTERLCTAQHLQMQSCAEVLGVRASAYVYGRYTFQCITRTYCSVLNTASFATQVV